MKIPTPAPFTIIPDSEWQPFVDEVHRTVNDLGETRQALAQAQGEIDALTTDALAAQETIRTLNARVETLTTQLDDAKLPPVLIRGRILGFTIENGKTAPDARQYGHVRTAMDWGQRQGLNVYRMFLNPTEMRNHAAPPKGYIMGNLIEYGTSRGLRYMADTMDRIAQLLPNDDDLKLYCARAIAQGCEGFYINDGDRKELSLVDLMTILLRLRKAAPGMPLFVSLMGNANLALYSKLLDRVEIQTFGSDAELANYLAIKAIPCLDLRRPLTASEIRKKANIIAAKPPYDLFFYADLASDYEAMPDEEDAIIRDLIVKLKAA